MSYEQKIEALFVQANDLMADYAIAIESGHADALHLLVVGNRLADLYEKYNKQFRDKANKEASPYGKEGVTVMGYKVRTNESAKYIYQYPEKVAKAMQTAKELKEKYEEFADNAKTPFTVIDPETGEVLWEVVPAIKKSTSGIKISEK